MHIWQAIKMAFKSLWTNKLRSFLTMLGIIIGVVTVSLLTTVAQGVSDAVVSSIRTQSTLGVVMSSSGRLTYSEMTDVLRENLPESTDDEGYYEYAFAIGKNVTAGSKLGDADKAQTNIDYFKDNNLLKFEDISIYPQTEEEQQRVRDSTELSDLEKNLLLQMAKLKRKTVPIKTSIYAVDKNFKDVYDMSIIGNFPKKADEILVDQNFVAYYLGKDVTAEAAINREVSLGLRFYTTIDFNFNKNVDDEALKAICNYLTYNYPDGKDDAGNDKFKGIPALSIIPNADGTQYQRLEDNKVRIVVEYSQIYKPEELSGMLLLSQIPEISGNVALTPASIVVKDVFDASHSKTYKICGVIEEDNSSIMGNMSSGTSSETSDILRQILGATSKGTCYMLLDSSNFDMLELGDENTNISSIPISFAYLRYKSESVMENSTTNIMFSLIGKGYGVMSDFMIVSMSSVANIISRVMDILTIMLTVISVISLIVGGIGIMNIMLVAVTERTREIGIRKAIGAKRGSILAQFLIEALMLSLVGGAIGLIISAIGTAIIGHYMTIALTMPLWVIAMSVGFCTAIGLIFGMFPAVKASRMQPIDALRRE